MQNLINEIVADLIALDSEFASLEEDLRKLVQKLLAAKPDAEIDEAFKKRLQNEIYAQALELQKSQKDSPKFKISNPFKMQKLSYTFAGAALAVLVLFTFQQFGGIERIAMNVMDDAAVEMGIEKVESQAFGSLVREETAEGAVGRGGGGGGGSPEMMSDSMMAPEYTVNKFVYSGSLDLPLGTVEVLKRVKGDASTGSLINSLARFDLDLVNLAALQGAKLQNFNLVEDREFGYMVMVDLAESSISINQNWRKWPDPYRDCNYEAEQNCYEDLRLGESDMLADSEILRIAVEFVQQMGINLDNYGEPKIIQNWKEELARVVDGDFYYPESISVTYPLKIQDRLVYSQGGGTEEGISVSVDQRNKKVSGVWGMQTQRYQASEYAAVADEALFRKFMEQGGLWGWMPEGAMKIREIPLGDPAVVLMRHWKYTDGESQELIVPALRFPVLEVPEGETYFYQKAVVIPLVQEILEESGNNYPIPEPLILESDMKILEGEEAVGLANPASVKCEADGYILEIIKDAEGNESGFCKNLEDKGCEEWEYFRGECEIPAVG
jgi:putative hemolysin